MKTSKLRQVTIVTEFCTEVPFQTQANSPSANKDRRSGGNRGVRESPLLFYAKQDRLQSDVDGVEQDPCRADTPVRRS
jgi:hypothetical protein